MSGVEVYFLVENILLGNTFIENAQQKRNRTKRIFYFFLLIKLFDFILFLLLFFRWNKTSTKHFHLCRSIISPRIQKSYLENHAMEGRRLKISTYNFKKHKSWSKIPASVRIWVDSWARTDIFPLPRHSSVSRGITKRPPVQREWIRGDQHRRLTYRFKPWVRCRYRWLAKDVRRNPMVLGSDGVSGCTSR